MIVTKESHSLTLIFTASVVCKNQVRNRQKIKFKNQFREIDISKNQIDKGYAWSNWSTFGRSLMSGNIKVLSERHLFSIRIRRSSIFHPPTAATTYLTMAELSNSSPKIKKNIFKLGSLISPSFCNVLSCCSHWPNVSTTPLQQWSIQQCLLFS